MVSVRDWDHSDVWDWVVVISWVVMINIVNQVMHVLVRNFHLKAVSTFFGVLLAKLEVGSLEAMFKHLYLGDEPVFEEVLDETSGIFFSVYCNVSQRNTCSS